ncbi:hypothetical protein [Peribacillus frigoritolerans]|uniref:DUF3870 domain-containing protein n=1 Tax=Peribacillus castrilensis TaxID=2897690 RepID=A0AAW9NMS1_9BACI|nr:hypothetical protein [Peribacillus castrilensis]
MKDYSILITNNKTGDVTNFDTNGILAAFISKELPNGSDTSQFVLGDMEGKEVIKLLAGCINTIYHVTNEENANQIVYMATKVARQAVKQKNAFRRGL